jgi:chromosome segregation ATPase
LRNSLEATEDRTPPEGLAAQILEETEKLKQQLADAENETLSKRESIEQLKQDLKSLEESNRRLEGGTEERGAAGESRQGLCRHRRSPIPDRSQDQRRARAGARRCLGQHARRDRRQRDPAAQHV